MHHLRAPGKRIFLFEFSLCLSRACLGKMIIFFKKYEMAQKMRFLLRAPEDLPRPPVASTLGCAQTFRFCFCVSTFFVFVISRTK